MNIKKLLLCLLLLVGWASANLFAQTAVTVGSQVTDVANIVSGKAYLLRWDGLTGTPYALDTGGSNYGMANNNTATQAAVYYLISDGNGGYKIENAYTGKYWPTPSSNGEYIAPTTAANAGTYTIAASGTANRFTFTCTVSGTAYHTNRSSSKLVAHTSDSPVSIYEVTASTLATAATYTDFTGKEFSVSASEAANISEGQWYVMSQRSRTSYVFENTSDHKLKHTLIKPSGSATEKAGYLVRLLSADGGKYYLQNGFGNYMGVIAQSTNVPTTAFGQEAVTVAKIGGTDGHFYLQGKTNSVILDGNDFTGGDPSTVVGWGTGAPTTTGGNNDWAFYPVELVESSDLIAQVYTINNTNTNRGALTYEPNKSTTYVWSSGKSGATAFDASNPNHQWVIIPSGTADQYYLYNVGAGKFAIPTAIAQGAGYPWIFSDNAVAVIFETQSDGTKKIKMASTPVNGSNAAYMAVSNNYTGPIINYNDVGGNFTITKVEGVSAQTQAEAAVAKLVKSQTALTSYPQATGWYAIQIKSKTGSDSYAGRYLQTSTTLYNDLYPLTFTGGVDIQPAITDPSFLTHIEYTSWDNNTWQLPDGRYLVSNSSSKFPTPSSTAGNVICGFDNGNYFKSSANYYADPYNSGANYFIGETTYMRTAYTVYPVDLTAAGLTAWKILSDGAPETAQITCSRSDVKGLTAVYKNGFFFLPTGVTPEESDFTLDGASGVTIDGTAHTVTFAYNPDLAIVEDGVIVEQGWQTAGRDSEVMLLKVTAKPFKAATNTTLTVSLKDGSEANISALKLYEANSNSPEIYSTGDGAPTKTEVATASINGSTATFTIGNLTAGTHYYWIGATVSSTATLGAVLDAAVTGIAYQVEGQTAQNLDLTSVGDPADRGAMVFNVHSYPFLPRDNGSRVYRIPAMIVADDGSIVVAADKRYNSHTDIGAGHVIDIVIRRSTDGGKTWSDPITVAKGLGTADDAKCGYGDPSLVKGKDGKLYCLFVAGNIGYFYGQKRIAMTTSTDNGVTWSSSESTAPIDLLESGRLKNYNTVGDAGYGLYDYFVTSGRGLYIPEDDILMYLVPAQTMTSATEHTSNSQDYIFYSRDGGESWYFSSQIMYQGGDEAKIIQMNDGSLLGSIRQGYNRGFNTATYTKNNDGTLTFTMGSQWNNSQLSAGGYANNQDIFYYQRSTTSRKTDIIFHSMTTGQHANFKLYYSLDQGANWMEFLTVQTKGTRYVTMDKNPANGSLYLLFEDQSLNSAGGYTDYNHYPLNFLEITREQLVQLIPALDMWVPDDVTIISQGETNGSAPWGTWTPASGWANKFTTNANSGKAGVEISATYDAFNRESDYGQRVFCIKPSAAGATDEITITAPEGFVIKGYSIGGHFWTSSELYTLTSADGLQTAEVNTNSGNPNLLTVDNIFTPTTTFSIKSKGSTNNRFACITTFNVSLIPLDTYARTTTPDNFGTLCLPYDALSYEGATFYKVAGKKMENDVLSYITLEEVTELKGGVGYLFQAGGNELTVSYCVTGAPAGIESGSSTGLIGSYESKFIPQGGYMLKDNKVYYVDRADFAKVGINKAYIDLSNVPAVNPSQPKHVRLMAGDIATGIDTIDDLTNSNQTIYNLSGQRLSKPVKGVNIVNGKIVLVK